MKLTLHFTDEEILKSLASHGYEVKRLYREEPEHIHGSAFITRTWYDYVATKDGHTEQYERAFEKLIKQKLLS
ncbi:MAG TPA: hypothetical protein VNQ80_12360 [Parapedobacter sp.]|uniref:hypothetical protein n=1 Tax=Parapedobacter sp. TaxID=1958893 RepID=UPI002B7ABF24|nr:hypothetical protein [Parapedobacter sp.]HWK58130.1 hypothetical protein [Parapedobacter sp.]